MYSLNNTDQYYIEVGRFKVLTPAKERELLKSYHTCPTCESPWPLVLPTKNCSSCGALAPSKLEGQTYTCTTCFVSVRAKYVPLSCPQCGSSRNIEPRQRVIESNLRFVIRAARRITSNSIHLQKLISAGNVGLVLAVDRFDISRGTRFLTYAAWWVQKEMLDELSRSNSLVHVPTYLQKRVRKTYRDGEYTCIHCDIRSQEAYGYNITTPCTETEHEFICAVSETSAMLQGSVPLETLDIKADTDVFQGALEHTTREHLRKLVLTLNLSPRDLFIVLGFFNIPAEDRRNSAKRLPQLSAITGITPERVRQVKERILVKLKSKLTKLGVTESRLIH